MHHTHKLLICALFLYFVLLGQAQAQKVGDPVPNFSLSDLDGKTYSPADYKGRVFVLYFMGYN